MIIKFLKEQENYVRFSISDVINGNTNVEIVPASTKSDRFSWVCLENEKHELNCGDLPLNVKEGPSKERKKMMNVLLPDTHLPEYNKVQASRECARRDGIELEWERTNRVKLDDVYERDALFELENDPIFFYNRCDCLGFNDYPEDELVEMDFGALYCNDHNFLLKNKEEYLKLLPTMQKIYEKWLNSTSGVHREAFLGKFDNYLFENEAKKYGELWRCNSDGSKTPNVYPLSRGIAYKMMVSEIGQLVMSTYDLAIDLPVEFGKSLSDRFMDSALEFGFTNIEERGVFKENSCSYLRYVLIFDKSEGQILVGTPNGCGIDYYYFRFNPMDFLVEDKETKEMKMF